MISFAKCVDATPMFSLKRCEEWAEKAKKKAVEAAKKEGKKVV